MEKAETLQFYIIAEKNSNSKQFYIKYVQAIQFDMLTQNKALIKDSRDPINKLTKPSQLQTSYKTTYIIAEKTIIAK